MATTKPAPEDTATAPVEQTAENEGVKVTVRSTPLLTKTAEAEPASSDLAVHHELTITPPTATTEAPAEVAETETETEPKTLEAVTTPAPVEPVAPKPPTDDAPKTEPKTVTETVPANTEEMQSPKVFDTKQYHLPIDEGVASGKSRYVIIFLVVLLLAVIAGVVAVDAGLVDIGIKLPFNLIK